MSQVRNLTPNFTIVTVKMWTYIPQIAEIGNFWYIFALVVGRVPGDYTVSAGYCTTRHYPDPAGYYVKMWPDPSNLSVEFYLYPTVSTALVHSVKPKLTE